MKKLFLLPFLSVVLVTGCSSASVSTVTETVDHNTTNTITQTLLVSNVQATTSPQILITKQAEITTTAVTTVTVSSPPTTVISAPMTVTNITSVTTTATTIITQPPVTVTTIVTTTPTVPATLANSIAFNVTPVSSVVTQIPTPQMIGYDVKYSNMSGTSFSSVNFVLTLTTNIPMGALTNTNNITLTTLGYTWTLGVGSGINGIYTFTGTPAINIPGNGVGEFVAILTITWNAPPPVGSYLALATVAAQ